MLATTTLQSEMGKYGPAVAPKRRNRPPTAPITTGNATVTFTVGSLTAADQIFHLAGGTTVVITVGADGGVTHYLPYGDQAYFWTKEWQDDEAEVDHDYATGNYYEPKDAHDLIRWLREG